MSPEQPKEQPKERRILLLDPDKLGFLAATVLSTGVVCVCVFYRRVSVANLAIRVGLTFVVSYVATFLFLRYALRTIGMEIARTREEKAKAAALEEDAGEDQPRERVEAAPGEPAKEE